MSVKVTFAPAGKRMVGRVEIDGLDVSRRITNVAFSGDAYGEVLLVLTTVLHDDDVVEIEVPNDDVEVQGRLTPRGLGRLGRRRREEAS